MKTIKLAGAGLLAIAAMGSAMAFETGQERRPPPPMTEAGWGAPNGRMDAMPLHGLELSDAQHDKLFAIMHAQAPQAHELHGRLRKAQQALHDLAQGEKFDDAMATALSQEFGSASAAMALMHARTAAQVKVLLTPEQRKRLADRPGPQHGGMDIHQERRK